MFLPGADLPDFELRAKGLGSRAWEALGVGEMTFDARDLVGDDARAVEAFLRLYRVDQLAAAEQPAEAAPGDDTAIRRVFSPEVMRLLAARPGWSAQACGGHLALWRALGGVDLFLFRAAQACGGHLALWRGSGSGSGTLSFNGLAIGLSRGGGFVPADRRATLIEDALAILEVMTAAVRRPASARVVPARPGGPRADQQARAAAAGGSSASSSAAAYSPRGCSPTRACPTRTL